MRSTSSAGLLLLVIAALGLIGFLTGNLDRWLAYLFDPARPVNPAGTAGQAGMSTPGLVSVGATTPRVSA